MYSPFIYTITAKVSYECTPIRSIQQYYPSSAVRNLKLVLHLVAHSMSARRGRTTKISSFGIFGQLGEKIIARTMPQHSVMINCEHIFWKWMFEYGKDFEVEARYKTCGDG